MGSGTHGANWQALGGLRVEADLFGVTRLAFGPDGTSYAGGDITAADGVETRGPARWDGARWVGAAGGPYGRVWCLAVGADEQVDVDGEFSVVRDFDPSGANLQVNNVVLWRPQG